MVTGYRIVEIDSTPVVELDDPCDPEGFFRIDEKNLLIRISNCKKYGHIHTIEDIALADLRLCNH